MNQPLNAGSPRLDCDPLGRLDMNGVKGLPPVFDIKTDCIDRAVSVSKRASATDRSS
jgi:hypothetical protein